MVKWIKRLYKKINEDISIKKRLIIFNVLLITLVIGIIGSIMYTNLSNKLKENEARFLHQNLESTKIILSNYFEIYLRKSDVIFSNTIMQEAISQDYTNKNIVEILDIYKNELYRTINPVMDEVYQDDLFVKDTGKVKSIYLPEVDIYVMNRTMPIDGLINEFESISHEDYAKETMIKSGVNVWRGRYKENGFDYISVNRQLKNFDTREKIGMLTIKIPVSQVEYILTENNHGYNMKIFIIDKKKQIIENRNDAIVIDKKTILDLSSEQSFSQRMYTDKKGNKYLVDSMQLDITGWEMVAIYPYNVISETLRPYQLLIVLIFVIGMIIAIAVSLFMSNAVTHRISRMINKMNRLMKNRKSKLEPIGGIDEIGKMDMIFNEMIKEINALVEKEVAHKLEHSKLEVELLQSQINPHILYNTLAVLSYKAKKMGETEICSVTDKLIRFFRYYLNSGTVMSNVGAEIEMIDHYVNIIKYTYNIDVNYEKDIDEEIFKYSILNLILQPIVENALIHGLKPSKDKKRLKIFGRKVHDRLYFEIIDNGIGMSKEQINDILIKNKNASRTEGYGIKNVISRIELYFGNEYGINKITSDNKNGTKVSLELPIL